MKLIERIEDFRRERAALGGGTVGLVPTMGALHDGHLSLVRACRRENRICVVSIFVNPAQFSPNEDFSAYPRDLDRDMALLEKEGVDLLFHPHADEMYPTGYDTYVTVDRLSRPLCGRSRPTHFRGVATVVLKLFQIVQPDSAYFGQKDAQQAVIISRMIRDLSLPVRLKVLPIVRDHDGLALSSRNAYLSPAERQAALALPRSLERARKRIEAGERDSQWIRDGITADIGSETGVEIDYIEIVSLGNLESRDRIDPAATLIAGAVRVGRTRLIDNFILGVISC